MDRDQFILALMETAGIGDRTLAAILRRNAVLRREPDEMRSLSTEAIGREYELNPAVSEALRRTLNSDPDGRAALSRRLAGAGICIVSIVDASYPRRLT